MPRQGFRSLQGPEPPTANQTTVAAAADTVLWDAANLTPIPANSVIAGQVFKVTAWGVTTTAITAGQSVVYTPRFGTAVGGTSLGPTVGWLTHAVVATNIPWHLQMYVHFRTIGATGTATCNGFVATRSLVGTAATTNSGPAVFGTSSTTATTVNTTTASGLVVSVSPNLATQTFTCLGVVLESLN